MTRSFLALLLLLRVPETFGLDFKGVKIGEPGQDQVAVQKLDLKCEVVDGGGK